MNLKGKTAIVTGGTGGLGCRICLAFAGRGCNVVVAFNESDSSTGQTIVIDVGQFFH